MQSFLNYNWPSILWAAFILVLCLLPGHDLPTVSIADFDKVVHFGFYVVLSVLLYFGWHKQQTWTSLHQNTLFKIALLTFAYGFAVEILQELLTADRHFDKYDALANACGGVSGSWIARYLYNRA